MNDDERDTALGVGVGVGLGLGVGLGAVGVHTHYWRLGGVGTIFILFVLVMLTS